MKKINIKDTVWFANGEHKLIPGRVVQIITLDHLNEGYIPGKELYVLEVETGIDNIFEVREWETISLEPAGPLNMWRNINIAKANRYLKKIGPIIPDPTTHMHILEDDEDMVEPSQAEILAALEGKPTPPVKPKKRHWGNKKKPV